MSMTRVHTDDAPAAIGPYSQGYVAGDFLFTAGQVPFDPATGETVGEDIATQTERAMTNLMAIVSEAGATPDQVLKTTCYLADMADFAAFNEVYERFVPSKPARTCVAARELPRGVLCEIEAVVYLGK